MAIQSEIYNADGSTRTYVSTKHIASKLHVRVFVLNEEGGDWTIKSQSEYELINNSIVFDNAYDGYQIEVRVADDEDELGTDISDISLVASNLDVITSVANNMDDINNAEENANSAIIKAAESLASANASEASRLVSDANKVATNADVVLTHADVVLTNADVVTTNTNVVLTNEDVISTANDASQTSLDRIATGEDRVQTGLDVIESTAQADRAELNANLADSISQVASSVNTNPDSVTVANNELTLTNSYFNYTAGITDKGYTLTSRDVTKTVDTSGVQDGISWVSENSDNSNSFYDVKPSYEWSLTGVAYKDGSWYNDNVLMNPTPSFIKNPVYIDNGIPQYIDYSQELETNVMPTTAFPDGISLAKTTWLNDGIDYNDPDAIGANPTAKIYPDGTIVGSTDNGSYTKYPNGDIIMRPTFNATGTVINGGVVTIIANLPCTLINTLGVAQVNGDARNFPLFVYYCEILSTTTFRFEARNDTGVDRAYGYSTALLIGKWKS